MGQSQSRQYKNNQNNRNNPNRNYVTSNNSNISPKNIVTGCNENHLRSSHAQQRIGAENSGQKNCQEEQPKR